MIKKVGIIGRGAVGSLFTTLIQDAIGRENVAVLVDEKRLTTYQAQPFYCNDKLCDFQYIANVKDFGDVDLILVVVKYPYLNEANETIAPFVKEDTIILSLLNGITSEQLIEDTLKKGIVIHAIAQLMDAVKKANHVYYTKTGEIVVGTNEIEKQAALQRVVTFFEAIKLPYKKAEDIIHAQWSKLMLNCAINQICAVYDVPYGACQRGGALHPLFVDTMKEVQKIAHLEGVMITDEEVADWVEALQQLSSEAMPSMRQDRLAKRKSEVDLFAKTMIELSKKHHTTVPINSSLYDKIIAIEAKY